MNTYFGSRDGGDLRIWVGNERQGGTCEQTDAPAEGSRKRCLAACPELFKGQTLPFNWGTDGPGTAHAAAALLVHLLGRGPAADPVIRATFPALRRFLAALPADDFQLSESFLLAFLQAAREPQPSSATGARSPG